MGIKTKFDKMLAIDHYEEFYMFDHILCIEYCTGSLTIIFAAATTRYINYCLQILISLIVSAYLLD